MEKRILGTLIFLSVVLLVLVVLLSAQYIPRLGIFQANDEVSSNLDVYKKQAADSSFSVGLELMNKDDHSGANFELSNAHRLYHEIGNLEKAAKVAMYLSHCKKIDNRRTEAVKLEQEALKYFRSKQNIKWLMLTCEQIGFSYKNIDDYNEAENYFREALNYAESLESAKYKANALSNLAHIFSMQGRYAEAKQTFLKSISLIKEDSTTAIATVGATYNQMAQIYYDQENYDSTIIMLNQALGYYPDSSSERVIGLVDLAEVYTESGNEKLATITINNALALADVVGSREQRRRIREIKATYAAKNGNYEDAYEMLKEQLIDLRYYLAQQEEARSLLEVQRQTKQLEAEKERLQADVFDNDEVIDKQNIIILAFLGVITFVVILIAVLFRLYRTTRQARERSEYLSREMHHRVKNNLQVLTSLLSLQSDKLTDESAKEAVQESERRMRAMSLIHTKLYQQEDATKVAFNEYLQQLLPDIAYSYGYEEDSLQLKVAPASLAIKAETAIPLSLVITELVSNAYKHAFEHKTLKKGWTPQVKVQLEHTEHELALLIKDNGHGLPEGFNMAAANNSFGLQLVNTLQRQLKGQLKYTNHNGALFKLSIPAPA